MLCPICIRWWFTTGYSRTPTRCTWTSRTTAKSTLSSSPYPPSLCRPSCSSLPPPCKHPHTQVHQRHGPLALASGSAHQTRNESLQVHQRLHSAKSGVSGELGARPHALLLRPGLRGGYPNVRDCRHSKIILLMIDCGIIVYLLRFCHKYLLDNSQTLLPNSRRQRSRLSQ